MAIPEAKLESTEHGLVPKGEGWFVLNARDAGWRDGEGRPAICDLEGDADFSQLGINLSVLAPGEAMAMYHWESDQEDFLVLAGEPVLVVEGEERSLRSVGLRALPGRNEARDRRGGERSGGRARRRCSRRLDRRGLGRLHGGRSCAAPRCGRRRGDHRRARGLCPVPPACAERGIARAGFPTS